MVIKKYENVQIDIWEIRMTNSNYIKNKNIKTKSIAEDKYTIH